MSLQIIFPCTFEDTSSESYPYWGFLGYSKAARFEKKSDTEIELYSYPLIKAKGTTTPSNNAVIYDILEDGSYAFKDYVSYGSSTIATFNIGYQTSWKTIYDILQEAPFTDGLEVNMLTSGFPYVWTRFKKPFAVNGRGGDSVPILDNSIETRSYSSFQFDEIPVGQNELFYMRDIFPDYDASLPPVYFCQKLHFSLESEIVKLNIKSETIENGTAWEDGAISAQTFQTKMVTYYYEKVPFLGIRGSFMKYGNAQLKYTYEFVVGVQDVMWVKF